MILGDIVKQQRRLKKLTQKELSVKAGVAMTTISFLECGQGRYPNSETLTSLALALDLYPAYLILSSIREEDVPAGNRKRFEVLRKEMIELLKLS